MKPTPATPPTPADSGHLVILDGTAGDSPAVCHLAALAERRGLALTRFSLADMTLAPCLGDFECWVRSPGLCRTRDGAREIARAMHRARLVVFVTPVVFGGYGADLKKAVDRLIGLVHPYFTERDGLTRHQPRYQRYAPLLCVGLDNNGDATAAQTFRELAAGNAINLLAPRFHTRLLSPADPAWQGQLEAGFDAALDEASSESFALPAKANLVQSLLDACATNATFEPAPPRKAAVFIGSARPKGASTSEALAQSLIDGLHAAGVATELIHASQFIKPGAANDRALETMLAADLLVVSAPLYVDGLPYLVTRALEQLAARLGSETHRLRGVAGILNCGYPEALHNRLAMAMLRHFSRAARLDWAGGLALGGGEVIHGRPLASLRFFPKAPARALQLAAQALAAGHGIPAEASRLMARPLIPAVIFRRVAKWRWLSQGRAHQLGASDLDARPYLGDATA